MIIWGHPDLIHLMRHGPCPIFMDCTFKVVPREFSQLLVIMVYAAGTGMYVPVYYVLLQSKREAIYIRALEGCFNSSDKKMRATTFTSDFEIAIITAMSHQFPTATPVVCLFHWKQSIRRKAKEYELPSALITHLIGQNGVMNILTVIPIPRIRSKEIPWCRSRTIETSHQR